MADDAPSLAFVKMQALGNDYVFLDAADVERAALHAAPLARRICGRRTGVGADGLIILDTQPHDPEADARMRIVNADGSPGGRCGNGLRCAARLLAEMRAAPAARSQQTLRIDVGGAIVEALIERDAQGVFAGATVNMGAPAFALDALPADADRLREAGALRAVETDAGATLHLWQPLGVELEGALVSVGNPHLVLFAAQDSDPARDAELLFTLGPRLEQHASFPQRVNAHIARVVSRSCLSLGTWERGVGATPACGTGACAAVAAATALNLVEGAVRVAMPGGALIVEAREGSLRLTGEAQRVFEGVYPLD